MSELAQTPIFVHAGFSTCTADWRLVGVHSVKPMLDARGGEARPSDD